MAYTIIETCIGCTACTKRCPTEAILDDTGDVCRTFPRKEWPKAIVIEDNCIGSGCELCIQICPFDALYLRDLEKQVGDFFGVAKVIEKRCTGCRLCEDACGWGAIYIDPPRELLKKDAWTIELEETREPAAAPAG